MEHFNQFQLFLVVNLDFECVEAPGDRGSPWDTPQPTPQNNPPSSSASSASGLHNHYQVRFPLSSCPPLPIRFVVCLICCQSSRGLHAGQELYRRPYSQINPIYQHRKGKRNTGESLKWERNSVTSFKNTVGYVTLYHYNSPLKALPRHLAYVWAWNWIRSCGNSNIHQSEKARARAHCTGEIKMYLHVK